MAGGLIPDVVEGMPRAGVTADCSGGQTPLTSTRNTPNIRQTPAHFRNDQSNRLALPHH